MIRSFLHRLHRLFRRPRLPDDQRVLWQEFLAMLNAGDLPVQRIRPYAPGADEFLRSHLLDLRRAGHERDWQQTPDAVRVGPLLHISLPLRANGRTRRTTFTFESNEGGWCLRQVTGYALDLQHPLDLPPGRSARLSEAALSAMRQQSSWAYFLRLFDNAVRERGRHAALRLFRDGSAYALDARTRVPFLESHQGFILYLCWEQSLLQGNQVTLDRLTDAEAQVRIKPLIRCLYRENYAMQRQISETDLLELYETLWRDRAEKAGWRVTLAWEQDTCTLRFARSPSGT